MNENVRTRQLMKENGQLKMKLTKLQGAEESLATELAGFDDYRSATLDSMRRSHMDEESNKIDTAYLAQIKELTDSIESLAEQISSQEIQEDADVLELRAKSEWLNQVIIKIKELFDALNENSNSYFIAFADTGISYNFKRYKKELAKVDSYVKRIDKAKLNELAGLRLLEQVEYLSNKTIASYVSGVLAGGFQTFILPLTLAKMIKRAKMLHTYSVKYHALAKSSQELTQYTAAELEEALGSILEKRRISLQEQKEDLENQFEQLRETIQTEKDAITYDESQLEEELEERKSTVESELKQLREDIEETKKQLLDVTDEINEMLKRKRKREADERDPYLNPRNPNRSVIFPGKFLYEWSEADGNTFYNIESGLWLYHARETAEEVVRLITYEMRNYMKYNIVRLFALDSLMALYLADLQLQKKGGSDIVIDSMKSDQLGRILAFHENMNRRRMVVKQVAADLNGYNDAVPASALSFDIIFYFLEAPQTLSEQLIQLLKLGSQLGLYIILFLNIEQLTIDNMKMYEKYVGMVMEVTPTGISRTPASVYRANFEAELEANKK